MNSTKQNWTLALIEENERKRFWPIDEGLTKLGRGPDNTIRLVHDSVSHHHAECKAGSGLTVPWLASRLSSPAVSKSAASANPLGLSCCWNPGFLFSLAASW